MSQNSWMRRVLSKFTKSATTNSVARRLDKELLAFVKTHAINSILDINIGDRQRVERLAKACGANKEDCDVRYVCVDEFESAQQGTQVTVKEAFQIVRAFSWSPSLVPGSLELALPRVAHQYGCSDLIIASGCIEPDNPQGLLVEWINRLSHQNTVLFGSANLDEPLVRIELDGLSRRLAA